MSNNPSRRTILESAPVAGLALAAVGTGAVVAAKAAEVDPIFALIEQHRIAFAEREAFLVTYPSPSDEDFEPIYNKEVELHRQLFASRAITIAGLAAYASYVRKFISEHPDGGEEFEGEFGLLQAVTTIAAAAQEIARPTI